MVFFHMIFASSVPKYQNYFLIALRTMADNLASYSSVLQCISKDGEQTSFPRSQRKYKQS